MTLPSTLATRLAKRGILSRVAEKSQSERENGRREYRGVTSCPNKSNPYHDCTHWCEIHWRTINAPDSRYVRNISKLLIRYPLPSSWTEVYEKGLGVYYFWDMENDLVSWLPPRHPKAFLSESAAKMRENRINGLSEDIALLLKSDETKKSEKKRHHKGTDSHHKRRKDKEHAAGTSHTMNVKRKKAEEDPMDPSSYSDIPPGTWTDGLDNPKNVDATVNGQLYKPRAYPLPGEVLNNKSKPKQKKNVNFGSVTYCN